jgi:hypothetical protein
VERSGRGLTLVSVPAFGGTERMSNDLFRAASHRAETQTRALLHIQQQCPPHSAARICTLDASLRHLENRGSQSIVTGESVVI